MFDYGDDENLRRYGNVLPPLIMKYPLREVLEEIPILCINGETD